MTCTIRGSVGMSPRQSQLALLMPGVAQSLVQHEALSGLVAPGSPKCLRAMQSWRAHPVLMCI